MKIDLKLLELVDQGFNNPLHLPTNDIAQKEPVLKSLTQSVAAIDTTGMTPSQITSIQKLINSNLDFTDLFKTNQNFKSHSQNLSDKFTYNVSQIQSYSETRLKDFCLSYESIAASISGWGKQILSNLGINIDTMIGQLKQLLTAADNIEKLVDSILNVKDNLDNLVDEIKTNIASEINNLNNILKANLSVFLAGVLPSWFDSACVANTVGDAMPNVYDYLRK